MSDVLCVKCNSYRCGPHWKEGGDYGMTLADAEKLGTTKGTPTATGEDKE